MNLFYTQLQYVLLGCIAALAIIAQPQGMAENGKYDEDFVRNGLEWLRRHQHPQGYWDVDGFSQQCEGISCKGSGSSWADPGATALALLAFLANGNTRISGEYSQVVRQATGYLEEIQDRDGCFGPRVGHYMYNHAIATVAMVETFTLSEHDPILRVSANRGVRFLLEARNPGMGWGYDQQSNECDISVTGWAVMALKAAEIAGIHISEAAFEDAVRWVDAVASKTYRVDYIEADGSRPIEQFIPSEAIVATVITTKVFAGVPVDEIDGMRLLLQTPPIWGNDSSGGSLVNYHYWYFGTLAMFQLRSYDYDNLQHWKWQRRLQEALARHQCPESAGCQRGSWDALDPWSKVGGRVYATAINILSLQLCYRYGWTAE